MFRPVNKIALKKKSEKSKIKHGFKHWTANATAQTCEQESLFNLIQVCKIGECYKGRFTRCDFDACDKLTTSLQHDLGPFTRARLFSVTKLNMQRGLRQDSGVTQRKS